MWFYESNHKPEGPVSPETMQELLRSGTINALTLVWQEGMADWKHLGETELDQLSRSSTPAVPMPYPGVPPRAASSPATSPQPSSLVVPGYNRVKASTLKRLFTWWAILAAVVAVYQVVADLFPNGSGMVALSCVAEFGILAFAVLQFILLYRFWQIEQDGYAATTPGRAVGFLFIPFFNIYWFFRAFLGLAIDQNRYIARHCDLQPGLEVRKAHPFISLLYLIVSLGGGMILYSIMFSQFFASSSTSIDFNALNAVMIQYTWPLLALSLAVMVLGFLMFLDFYLTAKSILAAEEKS